MSWVHDFTTESSYLIPSSPLSRQHVYLLVLLFCTRQDMPQDNGTLGTPDITTVQLSTTDGLPSTVWEVELVTFFLPWSDYIHVSTCAHAYVS